MGECGTLRKVNPHQLLKYFSSSYGSGLLRVRSNSVCWSIYVHRGKITYASHTVAALDRLSCNLQRLCYQRSLSAERILAQLSRIQLRAKNRLTPTPEYEAICSLVDQGYLDKSQADSLIKRLTQEAIQSFLLISAASYEIETGGIFLPRFCSLDVCETLEKCKELVLLWQSLEPDIWSPYQRPLLANRAKAQAQLTAEEAAELNGMLKAGISFYHLAVVLGQDELGLAQRLQPYIAKDLVSLGEPVSPFDQLPKLIRFSGAAIAGQATTKAQTVGLQQANLTQSKSYTIAFVDDSPSVIRQISQYLSDLSFKPVPIDQPIKALMQIHRHKPDIILLDIQMEQIDGYDLCKCLRNNSNFKQTPIIMVTGNSGILDRVRAKLVGASGYLTKPFDQAELLKTVFKYLH